MCSFFIYWVHVLKILAFLFLPYSFVYFCVRPLCTGVLTFKANPFVPDIFFFLEQFDLPQDWNDMKLL